MPPTNPSSTQSLNSQSAGNCDPTNFTPSSPPPQVARPRNPVLQHIRNPITHRPDYLSDPLYVITMVSNPWRFRSRWALYYDFICHMRCAGARLCIVEVAYGDRNHAVTSFQLDPVSSGNKSNNTLQHVQLRTRDELWHKENALNIGFNCLPAGWKYAAWIDADVTFIRPDIVDATLHALQHFPIVQMWSEGYDLDPMGHLTTKFRSFANSYLNSLIPTARDVDSNNNNDTDNSTPTTIPGGSHYVPYYGHQLWHPGYAWAIRRDAYEKIGGLLDFAIVGSADHYMAHALLGNIRSGSGNKPIDQYTPAYIKALLNWQSKALLLRKNLGCVEGTLLHHWHGKKRQRGYNTREKILVDAKYDPYTDLKRDTQGLYQLHDDGSDRFIFLRDQIRAYFRSRNEDSIDT